MAENKKYYYLKLKENFYDSEEMIALQNLQDGYLYSDILMKLYLRSLKSNGKLMIRDVIPYTPEVLAQITRHQVGTVKQAIEIFKKLGLIEILDNGAIYMLDIQNFIGLSSTEGDRKREYRNKINEEKLELGQMSGQMSDKRPPEIKDKNTNNNNGQKNKIYEERFEIFYKEYPRKVKKKETLNWFIKNKPSEELFNNIMEKLKKYKNLWEKKEKKYIPHPTSWLNQERWEDEIDDNASNDGEVKLVRSGENSFHIGG